MHYCCTLYFVGFNCFKVVVPWAFSIETFRSMGGFKRWNPHRLFFLSLNGLLLWCCPTTFSCLLSDSPMNAGWCTSYGCYRSICITTCLLLTIDLV
ncbi:hypothetical protein Hdeb2414_s0008g00284101 [Helianthus debilis subsp. tardiflorus]